MPDTENIMQLSKLFGVSVDYLLNDDIESDMHIPVVNENGNDIEFDMNIPIVRENGSKLSLYNRILLWLLSIGAIALICLIAYRLHVPASILIAGVVIAFAGVTYYLISFILKARRNNK